MAGTTKMIGNDILLFINLGDEATPNFVEVMGQTDYTHDSARETIDVSDKNSDHDQVVPGSQSGSISVTLMVERPDSADLTQAALKDAFDNRTAVTVQELSTFPGAVAGTDDQTLEAEGYITTYTKNAGRNDAATFDVEIQLIEALTLAA